MSKTLDEQQARIVLPSSRRANRRGDIVDLRVRECAAIEERAAIAHECDHGRITEAQGLGQILLRGARSTRELRKRKRSTSDPCHGLLHFAADERSESLGTRANHLD